MVFAYYNRLTSRQQAIYRESDRVHGIRLPSPSRLHPLMSALATALERHDRRATEKICRQLADAIAAALDVRPVEVRVLAARPHDDHGELHGYYCWEEERCQLKVWMRTAKRGQVVAFRTFLRTLLHELVHHLDFEWLGLEESFHTEGFYKRESSLFHQLVPAQSERKA